MFFFSHPPEKLQLAQIFHLANYNSFKIREIENINKLTRVYKGCQKTGTSQTEKKNSQDT